MAKIPENVVKEAQRRIKKGLNMRDRHEEASYRLAGSILSDAVELIESLGGKVVWERERRSG